MCTLCQYWPANLNRRITAPIPPCQCWKSKQLSRFWKQSNLTWRRMGWDFFGGTFADRSSSTCLLTFSCSISFVITNILNHERLLPSMLAPCRIASRYSEKNPLFLSLWNVFFLLPPKCPLWDTLFWARLDQWKHDDLRMLCFSVRFGRKWAIFGPISVAKRRISSIFLLGK